MKIEKLWKSGAKMLALFASAFLMFNVVACTNDDDDDDEPNKPVISDSSNVDYRIALKFDSEPTVNLNSTGTVRLYKLSDGGTVGNGSDPSSSSDAVTLVDTIKANEGESAIAATYYTGAGSQAGTIGKIAVKDNLLYVDGKELILVPHTKEDGYTRLEANTKYFVYADTGVISGTLNGNQINSISDYTVWTFTTGKAPSISNNTISVAQDGSANFYTIQGAFDYLRKSEATGDWTINVAAGTYHERLFYYGSANITLVGEKKDGSYGNDVEVNWKNADDWGSGGARSRATFLVQGSGNMVIKNMKFVNTYDRTNDGTDGSTQAETLSFDSTGNLIVYNSSFYSHQDTLYIGKKGNRSWFYKCYIEGDVDFLWGYADVALFEECKLKCVYDSGANSHASYIFASRSDIIGEANKGFVLLNSDVDMDEGNTVYYGRNSGSDTQATLLGNTFTGKGTLSEKLYFSKPSEYVLDDNKDLAIGYKDGDNYTDAARTTKVDTSNRLDGCEALPERVANREYSGRYVILNRGYSKANGKYATASTLWDLSAYEQEFNASADNSKNQIFVESVATWKHIGGKDVKFTAYDFSGKDITSSVTWTSEEKLDDKENHPDAIVVSLEKGVLKTKAQTSGTVTVKATRGNFYDVAYVYVIPTYIKVATVTFSSENASSLNQGALSTIKATLSPEAGLTSEVSDTTVTWTTSDSAVLKFFDSSNNAFVETITTDTPEVQIYGLKAEKAKITATSADSTNATSEDITVSSTVAEWNPVVAGVQVNTDVQSGVVGTYNTIIVDALTNNKKNSNSAKMGMKAGNTRLQTRNVILDVPVTADCDIAVTLESAPSADSTATAATASGLAYQGLYADGKKIVWDADTNTYTIKVDYETQAVAGDKLELTSSTKGDNTGDFTSATKYAQIVFGSKDVYITKITRTTDGQSYSYAAAVPYDVEVKFAESSDVELDLNGGATITRAATVSGADSSKVTVAYSSSDTTVATVDDNGKVTAVGKGTAVIKAVVPADNASESFKEATYNVSVVDTGVNGAYTYTFSNGYGTWLSGNYNGELTGAKAKYETLVLDAENVSGANFKYDGGNKCLTTSNGIIRIPVTGDCTITVTCHNYNSQFIGIVGSDNKVAAINSDGGKKLSYTYTGEAGYVDLTTTTAGNVLYIYSIKVENVYTSFDLGSSYSTWLVENYSGEISGKTEIFDHLVLDAKSVSGANFKYDGGNNCLTTSNGIIRIPVTGDCTITVTCHNYNSQFIGIVGSDNKVAAINSDGGKKLSYTYTGEAGYVDLTTTTAGNVLYLYKIVAEYAE